MTQAEITERLDFYWAHRSQRNMGWTVELWPGWQVKWSGWNLDPPDGVWDAEWRAVPVKAEAKLIVDTTRSEVVVHAQALEGHHEHDARMAICAKAFSELAAEIEKQSPTVGQEEKSA